MTFTVYESKDAAIAANSAEALARGCNMQTTREWFARYEHPDGRSALEDGGNVTREHLVSDGWVL